MELERPEIGQQGYYFIQTADIDCSELTSWVTIDFIGNYDGRYHEIKSDTGGWLFNKTSQNSCLRNMKLQNLGLGNTISDRFIYQCETNHRLNYNLNHATIDYCIALNITGYNIVNSQIKNCNTTSYITTNINNSILLLQFFFNTTKCRKPIYYFKLLY